MASKVNHTTGARTVRHSGGTAASASDRSRDFRRARRHTLIVSSMRYALPVAALAMAGYFGLTVLQRSGWGVDLPAIPLPKILPENLTMNNPRYEGFNADGGRYEVTARTAQQDFGNTNVVKLDTITGVMFDSAGVRTDLAAGRGVFNSQTNRLDLADSVDIASANGMKAKLKSAVVQIKESIITSTDPVEVEMTAGTVRANEMKLRHKSRDVTFIGSVETHLKSGKPPNAAPRAVQKKPDAAQPFGASDAPIDITSNRLDVNDNEKLAVFTGAVRAVQGGATLTSPDLHVTYAGQAPGMPAAGKSASDAANAGDLAAQTGKVKTIVASGPVVMTQANGDRATSETANFDAEQGKAFLDGQVVMTQAPDRRASSNRAELDQRAETVLLVGNVMVSQGRNELKGQRLQSDRKAGRTRVTSPAADGGDGRIAARFYRNAPSGADGAKAAAAPAVGGGLGAATFKTDPNAPVDINADSLDINDQRKAAVFVGDVLAVQGGFTLRTAEMTAFYTGEAGLGGGDATPARGRSHKRRRRAAAHRGAQGGHRKIPGRADGDRRLGQLRYQTQRRRRRWRRRPDAGTERDPRIAAQHRHDDRQEHDRNRSDRRLVGARATDRRWQIRRQGSVRRRARHAAWPAERGVLSQEPQGQVGNRRRGGGGSGQAVRRQKGRRLGDRVTRPSRERDN